MSELKTKITKYPQLEVLDLSGNNLRELPEELCRLKKLKRVNISNNNHLNWSQALFTLSECPKLSSLILSNNSMAVLPAEIYHFDGLQELILDGNRINPFSDRNAMNLPETLQRISLIDCDIPYISRESKKLKKLRLIRSNKNEISLWHQLHWMLPKVEVVLN